MSARKEKEEEAECSDEYPDRVNMLKVSDTKRKNYVLSSSRVLSFGTASAEKKKKKKTKRGKQKCVSVIFSRPGEDSFFLPVAFAAGSTRPLRDINYIFQRWMQFRNKNPLNMSDM